MRSFNELSEPEVYDLFLRSLTGADGRPNPAVGALAARELAVCGANKHAHLLHATPLALSHHEYNWVVTTRDEQFPLEMEPDTLGIVTGISVAATSGTGALALGGAFRLYLRNSRAPGIGTSDNPLNAAGAWSPQSGLVLPVQPFAVRRKQKLEGAFILNESTGGTIKVAAVTLHGLAIWHQGQPIG